MNSKIRLLIGMIAVGVAANAMASYIYVAVMSGFNAPIQSLQLAATSVAADLIAYLSFKGKRVKLIPLS